MFDNFSKLWKSASGASTVLSTLKNQQILKKEWGNCHRVLLPGIFKFNGIIILAKYIEDDEISFIL